MQSKDQLGKVELGDLSLFNSTSEAGAVRSLRTDKDYATGKSIDLSKPEEPVRQDTAKWLCR